LKQLSIRSGIVIPATAATNAAYWSLRIGSGLCFIGHGAFGIITKREWLPYFAVVGIPADWAFSLMPLIGAVDIAVGIVTLLAPRRAVLAYMAVWALWTALLRPLSGASVFELIERAGNYGVPFAFLLMLGMPRSLRDWFRPVSTFDGSAVDVGRLSLVLRATTAMLLFAHGALGALERKASDVDRAPVERRDRPDPVAQTPRNAEHEEKREWNAVVAGALDELEHARTGERAK